MPDNNPLQDLLLLRVVAEAGPVQSKARKGLWFVSRGSCNIEVRNMTLIFLKKYINNISRPPYMHIQNPPRPFSSTNLEVRHGGKCVKQKTLLTDL